MAKASSRRTKDPEPEPAQPAGQATLTDAAVATLVTGTALAGEWLALAGAQAGALTQTLAAVLRGDDTLEDGARSALDVYGESLRQMALLPRTYGLRFYQELEQSRSGRAAAADTSVPPEPRRSRPSPRRGRGGRRKRR